MADFDEGVPLNRVPPSPEAEEDRFDAQEQSEDIFDDIGEPEPKRRRGNDDGAQSPGSEKDDVFGFFNDEAEPGSPQASEMMLAPDSIAGISSTHLPGVGGSTAFPGTRDEEDIKIVEGRDKMIAGPKNPSFIKTGLDRNMPSFKQQKERLEDQRANQPQAEGLNDFEQALIKLKGNRRIPDRMTDMLAADEAKVIVEEMDKASKLDVQARRDGFPALAKMLILKKVCRLILRDKIGDNFIVNGGLEKVCEWLTPAPGVPLKYGAPAPEIVDGMLRVLDRLPIKKNMLLETKIGVAVKKIWHDKNSTNEVRRLAEKVCVKWLTLFQKGDDDDEDNDGKAKADEAEEDKDAIDRPIIESKRNPNFWQPTEEQIAANEWSMKNMRHAMRPVSKPLFTRECLPESQVSSKVGWNKTNPETTMGKVDRRVQALANPNKKAWKNSLNKQVSVEGRGLN